jgi:hypothetical protein
LIEMDDDLKILSGAAKAQCPCCELPFFSVTCGIIYNVGLLEYSGIFTPLGFSDNDTPPNGPYLTNSFAWSGGGTDVYTYNPNYSCSWGSAILGNLIDVQPENIDRTVTGSLTGTVTESWSGLFDLDDAANDAFNALVAVDPEPDRSRFYPPGPLSQNIGYYNYRERDFWGRVRYDKYFFYIQELNPNVPNYIKIKWDIGRVVHDFGQFFDYSLAEILETDLEYVFTDVLNYGDGDDPRRFSDEFGWIEHLQAEANPIVTYPNEVSYIVCNVRLYRSPSVREYFTNGLWIEGGVLSTKDAGYERD